MKQNSINTCCILRKYSLVYPNFFFFNLVKYIYFEIMFNIMLYTIFYTFAAKFFSTLLGHTISSKERVPSWRVLKKPTQYPPSLLGQMVEGSPGRFSANISRWPILSVLIQYLTDWKMFIITCKVLYVLKVFFTTIRSEVFYTCSNVLERS